MKNILFIAVILVSLIANTTNSIAKGKDKDPIAAKMTQAKLKYNDGDYYGALRIYRGIYKKNKENGKLNYRIGQCLVKVNKSDSAIVFLDKSIEIDSTINKEAYYLLGQAYHNLGNLDKAISLYEKYKVLLSETIISKTGINKKQNEKHFVNILLRQCLTAKELIANPVNVDIKNLGKLINTPYTDASPSVTADNKTLIFTSRRPETTGGKIDPAVEEYFDDIYISTWDDNTKAWQKAKQLEAPINTEAHDANMSITPDGKSILIYRNILGETKSGDIYVSEINEDGSWGKPKAFEKDNKFINTTYFETSACMTADEKTMYFVSEREKGGLGNGDIYVTHKKGKTWSKPENLGLVVNSVDDEIGVYIHPDGKTLFFSSNGHNTMGGYDIFMTLKGEDGKWSTPINMGYPINTTANEIHFVFTTDRKKAFISSSRKDGMGKYDIYEVNMAYYFKSNKNISQEMATEITGPPLSILKGTVVDAKSGDPMKTMVLIKNLETQKTSIVYSKESGEYFATLPAGVKYSVTVKKKGYKPLIVKFKLPKGEKDTYTLTKHLFVNKK